MRLIRILVAAAIVLGVPVLFASSASGTINGTTYNATQTFVVIPRKGDVHWSGAIQNASGTRDIEGKVYLKFPPPFGKIVVANGDWNGPSSRNANSGKYHYDLPSVLVGPKFTLYGHHAERGNVVCTGTIDVRLAGSRLKNPALLASLVLTVLAVVNLALVMRAKPIRP